MAMHNEKNAKPAISVNGVSKTFKLPHERAGSVKSATVALWRRRKGYEMQKALENISFEVRQGEFFGIVGRNGSGKSTLLKIIAGIYVPTGGSIQVSGSLTPFIELGVGFNQELTGRENVYLNGALLGFSRKEIDTMYKDIISFAELERFMDQKLKNYSSGMQVRLAFSIAIRAESDILLLDEVLAVGDAAFQQKCFDYFRELRNENRTVLLVSHNIDVVKKYCDNGVLLENGKLIVKGNINQVTEKYLQIIAAKESKDDKQKVQKDSAKRFGNRTITISKVIIGSTNKNGNKSFDDNNKEINIKVFYESQIANQDPIFGISIEDSTGKLIFSSNNQWHDIKVERMRKGDKCVASWKVPNIFNTGLYHITPAVADGYTKEVYDRIKNMTSFRIRKQSGTAAATNPDHKMELEVVNK